MQQIEIVDGTQDLGNGAVQGLRKWFTKDNLIILVLAGVLLFVIALPTRGKETADTKKVIGKTDTEIKTENETMTGGKSKDAASTLDAYALKQEEKLRGLLETMEGVGKVEVMITYASSEELVVEKDAPVVRSNTVEKDSSGGSRTVTQYEAGDTTVYNNDSGEGKPYVIKTLSPRVEGVLVVAQGAGDPLVSHNIAGAVQALFGVEAHRVKVLGMDGYESLAGGNRSGAQRTVTGLSGN